MGSDVESNGSKGLRQVKLARNDGCGGVKGADCGTASEKFPPRDIPPLTPYVWAEDPDCDLGVVSQALMLASKARMNRMIKVLIEFIQDHPLYFVFSQDSTPLRSVPMFPYKKLNTFTSSST